MRRLHRLAGFNLDSDLDGDWLRGFSLGDGVSPKSAQRPPRALFGVDKELLVYGGPGELGGVSYDVECRRTGPDFLISVKGAATLRVSADGASIERLQAHTAPTSLDVEVALGPGLLLALALNGVFCLHAGAVLVSGRIMAFVGASGAGKSTLSRELPRLDASIERAADDILPFSAGAQGAEARPSFPQPRLSPTEQYGTGRPERIPIEAVYVLGEPTGGEVRLEPLSRREAALALVKHTMAARLFDEALTAQHLELCATLARGARIARLSYPRTLSALPRVLEAVSVRS